MTYRIKNILQNLSINRLEAEVLLAHVLHVNRTYLHTYPEREIPAEEYLRFLDCIEKRKTGMPVAYITGEKEFWSLRLKVTPDTLIPRNDTEVLVETVLEKFKPTGMSYRLLELATGSGAVSIALAKNRPDFDIIATDICKKALQVAQENRRSHRVKNLEFIQGNWFFPLKHTQKFDAIVCNPPYVGASEFCLSEGELRFEPMLALTPGETGLEAISLIIQQAKSFLCDHGGCLFIEHGYNQGEKVAELFWQNGYAEVNTKKDINNFSRVTFGTASAVQSRFSSNG